MDVATKDRGVFVFGPFRLDATRRSLSRGETSIKLAARLFDTLLYLVENPGRLIEKDELLDVVWSGRIVEESNLTQTISQLRKVLGEAGDAPIIQTVSGRGYRLAVEVRRQTALAGVTLSDAVFAGEVKEELPPRPFVEPSWWRGRVLLLSLAALALLLVGADVASRLVRAPPRDAGAGVNAPAPFSPPPHSVAVLAFSDLSDTPDAVFAQGLAEETINTLGRIKGLQVAARTSAFAFQGKQATVPEIARQLNVAAVLEGSVRQDGSHLRVNSALIDGATGYQLWSRVDDRDARDRLALQVSIATAVAGALRVALTDTTTQELTLGGTTSPSAFDDYLRGMQIMRGMGDGDFAKARDAFTAALRLDPNYARAQAGLAYAICDMALNPPPELTPADVAKFYQQALAAADRAVAIAPELASGHAARSAVLSNGFHDFNQASAEAARAVALEPGNAGVLGYYAQLASDLGHMSDAVAAAQHAAVLDPLRPDVWDNLAYVLIAAHQYDAALQASRHGATLRGGAIPAGANDVLVRIYLLQGNPRAALAICPNSTSAWRGVCQTIALHALGQLAAAQSALNQFMATTGGQSTYNYVQIYAQWGDTGRALDWLDKAAATHDQVLETMKSDPLVDPLRASPRFQAVLRGMNFPP